MRKIMLALVLCTFLAGCDLLGSGSSTDNGSPGTSSSSTVPAATDTPSSSDSSTPAPAVTPTPTGFVIPTPKNCGSTFPTDGQYGYVGDMIISQPHFGRLSYLGLRLPDNMPAGQPYAETTPTSTGPFVGGVFSNPSPIVLADPDYAGGQPTLGYGDSGFVMTICNTSTSQSHVLKALGMQIATFTPATGSSLDIQAGCDSAVSATHGPQGGCGGSSGAVNGFEAAWPSGTRAGTQVTLTQVDNTQTSSSGFGNLPITLGPGKTYQIDVGTNFPGQSGTYTFQFGMQVDGNDMLIVGGTSYPLFMAAHVHVWSGTACYANAAWKAIVKAGTKWYVCPQANY